MTAVRRLREAINETRDRWESAAASLETSIASPRTAICRRIEIQKGVALRMAARLKEVLHDSRELAPEAREKIIAEIDQLAMLLAQNQARDRETALRQKEGIESVGQNLERRLDRVSDDVHPDLEAAVKEWIRAQMELDVGLELAAQRFAYERIEGLARFERGRRELLRKIEQFRMQLGERSISATRRGRPFGPEMSAAYDRIRSSFYNLASSSSANE